MSMSIKPISNGGRHLQGKTPWGVFDIETDIAGVCVKWEFKPRSPEPSGFDPKTESKGCCDPPILRTDR